MNCLMLLQLLPNFAFFFFDLWRTGVEKKRWGSKVASLFLTDPYSSPHFPISVAPGMWQLSAASVMSLSSFPLPLFLSCSLVPLPGPCGWLQPSPGEPLWKWSPSWSTLVTCCSFAVGCGTMSRASTGCGTGYSWWKATVPASQGRRWRCGIPYLPTLASTLV